MSNSTESLLRAIVRPDDLRPLLAGLGFGQCWVDLDLAALHPLTGGHAITRAIDAGAQGTAHALVIVQPARSPDEAAKIARRIAHANPARLYLFAFTTEQCEEIEFAAFGGIDELRTLTVTPSDPHPADIEALEEMRPKPGEVGIQIAIRIQRALDRQRVGRRFFHDFKAQRDAVAAAWRNLPGAKPQDRRQLALLLLSRLMFLYFLQRRGHLDGDADFVMHLYRRWSSRAHAQSFYRGCLRPLFFGALNRREELRTRVVRSWGALPYLNGGLFEQHALERRWRRLDLPDITIDAVFRDLLQRYRFTVREPGDAALGPSVDLGVDPEMLGRVFEELMEENVRGDTGTFFTPAAVVDRIVSNAIDALHTNGATHRTVPIRVLDPACGSGAFLLGALARLGTSPAQRRCTVEHSLYGVDLQKDAALLCALRLWLALVPGYGEAVEPLPNLDRRIRQGDALVDPLDLLTSSVQQGDASRAVAVDRNVRAAVRGLPPLAQRYLRAEPYERDGLRAQLDRAERNIGRAWLQAIERVLARRRAELHAVMRDVDLFGEATAGALQAKRGLHQLEQQADSLENVRREITQRGALPFFSFPLHFADAAIDGFDLIVSNPPWVRAHRWPAAVGRAMRERYEVCRPGWIPPGLSRAVPAAQIDLALLFLERSLYLLRDGGALGMLLPAKIFRSLYAGSARALLLRDTRVIAIEDHGLDQRAIFKADAFAGAITAIKTPEAVQGNPPVRVTMVRRGVCARTFDVPPEDLPFIRGEPASPWLLVPGPVRDAIRRMQRSGPTLSSDRELAVHRGVFTGANDVLIIRDAQPKLGGLASIVAEGYRRASEHDRTEARRYRGIVEEEALRPMVRGAGVDAWKYSADGYIVWQHEDGTGRPNAFGPRMRRYLAQHTNALQRRHGWRAGLPLGSVFRLGPHTFRPKVAWHDLADSLKAVMLPAAVRCFGREQPLIPLNTVYYIAPPDEHTALLLCALFNSLPVSTFVRCVAERAKDAHFRFFAWTIGCIPLPDGFRTARPARELVRIARAATADGGLDPDQSQRLDGTAARLFKLRDADLAALRDWDAWLRGKEVVHSQAPVDSHVA